MPRAVVLTTASKASLAGGTFADTLTANSGDSLAVANYDAGGARILEMWAIDSASVAETKIVYTRPEASHDQQHGIRFGVPSLLPGGAGKPAAHSLLPGLVTLPVFKSDVATISVSGTVGDGFLMSYLIEYDDLPGASSQFASWDQIQALRKSTVGIQVTAVASGTVGAYGATRAFNADDDRLHADTYYAILGVSVQTAVTTVALIGPAWGGQVIGLPCGVLDLRSDTWFVDQSIKWGKPMIPFFSSNDKANVLVKVADDVASTSPKLDFLLYELTARPS